MVGGPISLESRRTADLADALDERIAAGADCFVQPIGEIENPERWRRAARIVGKRRGWKTSTGVNDRCVWMADERGPGPTRADPQVARRLEALIAEALGDED